MNIYEIGQDFDNYKFFVFKEDDKSNKDVWDYNGQSLVNEWKGLSLELFRDKRKKKDKRSEDFDASCYFSVPAYFGAIWMLQSIRVSSLVLFS